MRTKFSYYKKTVVSTQKSIFQNSEVLLGTQSVYPINRKSFKRIKIYGVVSEQQ